MEKEFKIKTHSTLRLLYIRTCFLIFLILFGKFALYSFDFELMPTNIHFFGAVVAGKNIIAYGSSGSYMMTTDRGATWNQYSLHPNGNILHMIYYNDTLWGVIDNGIIFYSVDYGTTWVKRNFVLDKGEKLYFILPTNDCFFVRTTNGIYKLDKEFKVNSVKKDSLLKIVERAIYDFDGNQIPLIEYATIVRPVEIFLFKNKILALSDKYPPGMLVLDYDLTTLDTIVTTEHIYYNVKGSSFGWIDYLFPTDNALILSIEGNLYITDDINSRWRYFFPDTSFLNPNELERAKKWPYEKYSDDFFFWNNKLHMDMKRSAKGKYSGASPLSGYGAVPLRYYIKRFEMDESGQKLDFVKYGNHFEDRSIAWVNGYYGLTNATFLVSLKRKAILEDSIIVLAGLYKTIIQTRNGLKSWELVSCNTNKPEFILNDSTYVFFNRIPWFNTTSVSFDAGLTFKPTEFGLDTLYRVILSIIKDSLGNIIKVDTSYANLDTVSYFTAHEGTSIFHIEENGKGFWIGFGSHQKEPYQNFAVTKDYGVKFKFDTLSYLGRPTEGAPSKVIKVGGSYVFPLAIATPPDYQYSSTIYFLDTNFHQYFLIRPSPVLIISQILPLDKDHFIVFANKADTSNPKFRKFVIAETFDNFNTITILDSLDYEVAMNQYYVHNQDSVFFTDGGTLFLFDVKTKELITLYENYETPKIFLTVLNDHFYLVGRELFLENTNRSDLTQWQEGKWDYGKPNFESVIFKGNVAIAGLSDSLRPFNYYKITLKKDTTTSVEDSQIDARYYTTHFYATEPYPLPAHNIVKSKIYWGGSFDLVQAIDGVYDVMGNRVEGKQRITIKELGKATAELTWNCSGVPSGIYFIVVRHNGRADTIPVIVE